MVPHTINLFDPYNRSAVLSSPHCYSTYATNTYLVVVVAYRNMLGHDHCTHTGRARVADEHEYTVPGHVHVHLHIARMLHVHVSCYCVKKGRNTIINEYIGVVDTRADCEYGVQETTILLRSMSYMPTT